MCQGAENKLFFFLTKRIMKQRRFKKQKRTLEITEIIPPPLKRKNKNKNKNKKRYAAVCFSVDSVS